MGDMRPAYWEEINDRSFIVYEVIRVCSCGRGLGDNMHGDRDVDDGGIVMEKLEQRLYRVSCLVSSEDDVAKVREASLSINAAALHSSAPGRAK